MNHQDIPPNLNKILIKSRKNVFSGVSGNHISKFKGSGLDFADLKEYTYGDDIRHIDWIISAKSGNSNNLIIKEFYEERELEIAIFSLYGSSMYFGSSKMKYDILLEIVSFLGLLAIKNSDLLSMYLASDDCKLLIKPNKKIKLFNECMKSIYSFNPIGTELNMDKVFHSIRTKIKRKSLIFLVGDFINNVDFDKISNKHEVIAIIIRDKYEDDIFTASNLELLDPKNLNNKTISINDSMKRKYNKIIEDNDKKLYSNFHKNKIRYIKIYTDEDPYFKISKFLK